MPCSPQMREVRDQVMGNARAQTGHQLHLTQQHHQNGIPINSSEAIFKAYGWRRL